MEAMNMKGELNESTDHQLDVNDLAAKCNEKFKIDPSEVYYKEKYFPKNFLKSDMMTSYDVTKWKCRPKGENHWFLFDDVIGISRIGEMKMKNLSSTTQYDSIDTKTKVSLLMVKILWKFVVSI